MNDILLAETVEAGAVLCWGRGYVPLDSVVASPDSQIQGRLQRGKWTQLASSLAQGGKNSTLNGGGENSPRYMGHIDDCTVSSCH